MIRDIDDLQATDDYQHSCANCRYCTYIQRKNGNDLICDMHDVLFGSTLDDVDPMDVASEKTCVSFRR